MPETETYLKFYTQKILLVFLSVITAFFLLFLFIFICLPIYIVRFFVSQLSKVFRPDLGEILCPRSSICAIDDLHNNPKNSIVLAITVEGIVELNKIKDLIICKVLRKHEIFKCYWINWCNFLFWKTDTDFNIDNHARVYEKSEICSINECEVGRLRLEMIRTPFSVERSPWEVLIVKNFESSEDHIDYHLAKMPIKKTVLILRCHHGLLDGYSLLHLFVNELSDDLDIKKFPKPKFIERTKLQKILFLTLTFLLIPYQLLKMRFEADGQNEFHVSEDKLTRRNYAASERIKKDTIELIKTKFEVTFTSVLLAGLTGGIRSYLITNGMKLPDHMNLTMPLPWPGATITSHSLTNMKNCWSYCSIKLPLKISDPVERLKSIEMNWRMIKCSTIPTMNFYLIALLGSMNTGLIKRLSKIRYSTLLMSNFPGPPRETKLFGYNILDVSFGGGLGLGSIGLGLAVLSNNGKLRINIGVDSALLSSQSKVQEIMTKVIKEFHTLSSYDSKV